MVAWVRGADDVDGLAATGEMHDTQSLRRAGKLGANPAKQLS